MILIYYFNFLQPVLHLFLYLLLFVAFHYKDNSVSFYTTFSRKSFRYFTVRAKFFYGFETTSHAIARICIEWNYSSIAQIILMQKTFHWRRQLHSPGWKTYKHNIV